MHPLFKKADELSRIAIGAAIEVHRLKGIATINQRLVRIEYKGLIFDEPLRFDELKSVQEVLPIHEAQLLSYMKLLDVPLGLIINFHKTKLVDGVVRMILPGANQEK